MEFYPLAEYCNGIISAFNELRLCAPVALSTLSTKLLQESLHNVARAMLVFYKQEQQVSFYHRTLLTRTDQFHILYNVYSLGFCSCGTREHDEIHRMLERTINSLYTVLYTRDFSTRSNCNAFRGVDRYTPKRSMYAYKP